MFPNPLKEEVDVHDLQASLEQGGTEFAQKVRDYLALSTADLKRQQDQGLAPEDFQNAEKLKTSIESADRILQFFSNPR